ncbi:MAG: hypothetical protein B6D37_04115 [Sphingobacteriales bacterium UTBCD1]|jgi:hypothetical protein|nr:MAG: hypothetical protein B6D37_04115 [Sphingobacteriales bacterium UTBCD1]
MKKLIFIAGLALLSGYSNAQPALEQVAKYYFRSNPFAQEISSFLQQLINDPSLTNTRILKRTDTSLFYFTGEYKNFNPFFFKPEMTSVILSEKELILNDSLNIFDTVFVYQIAGYTAGGKEGENDVQQEFKRFDRKYLKKFATNELIGLKTGNITYGEIRNYYITASYLSPLSVAWQVIGNYKRNVFVITLRFKMNGNFAVLPITPDHF